MSYKEQTDTTKLKDIDEELRQKLVIDLLEKSDLFLISKQYENAYLTLKQIFIKILPFDFNTKAKIEEYTSVIDSYIDGLGGKAIDGAHKVELQNMQMQFKELLNEYAKMIPYALYELGLYFRIIKTNLDDDELFNEKTFNIKQSYRDDKIKDLLHLSSEQILKYLTTRQINDVHTRFSIQEVKNATTISK